MPHADPEANCTAAGVPSRAAGDGSHHDWTWRISGPAYYGGLALLFFTAGGWTYQAIAEPPLPDHAAPTGRNGMGLGVLILSLLCLTSGWRLAAVHRRRWQAGTLLFGVMFAATLVLAESMARWCVPAWPALGLHGVSPSTVAQPWNQVAGQESAADVNTWGQRDRERALQPQAGMYRLAFIGDSFLEESTTTPLSLRVERFLERPGVEVVNLGVSATSPDEYYDRLRHIALRLGARHCVVFIYAGNDLVDDKRTLASWGGIAAVSPRGSFLESIGLRGVNHLLTNHERPVLQAWLAAGDLRREEEYRGRVLSEVDPAQLPTLLLQAASPPPEQRDNLRRRLSSPEMAGVFAMLRSPDAGLFRSYYLTQALAAAADPDWQWEENSEVGAAHWMLLAQAEFAARNVKLTVVIIPEGCQVDSRMAEQWRPLADMRHVTRPCRDAAVRLRQKLESAKIDVVDLHEPLQDVPGTYLNVDGHWSDAGVELVARLLAERLGASQP